MAKYVVVGAGPGGLASALLLQHQGHEVIVYEKDPVVGGRSKVLKDGPYRFSAGPSFLMYIEMLDLLFERVQLPWRKDLKPFRLDPLYELKLPKFSWKPSGNPETLSQQIETLFQSKKAYDAFMKREAKAFDAVQSVMLKPFPSRWHFMNTRVLNFGRYVSLKKSVADKLNQHFKDPNLRHSMTFQAKYLGMSPQETPDFFTVLTYLEHQRGLYHVEGGIEKIIRYMAQQFKLRGGTLHLNTPVQQILVSQAQAQGVKTAQSVTRADGVIVNADFPELIHRLLPERAQKTYTKETLKEKQFSVSAFMVYLGLNTQFAEVEHHTMIFSDDYDAYTQGLIDNAELPKDPTVYLYNPSKHDVTYAPKGHSSWMLLAPVPNNLAGIPWEKLKQTYAETLIRRVARKMNLPNLSKHIVSKTMLTPNDWQNDYRVHLGSVFSLKHQFDQLLHKRPHNHYDDVDGLYLVGGSTHPGSGLSTIVQSAMIASDMIAKKNA